VEARVLLEGYSQAEVHGGSQLRNARPYAEQTLKVQMGTEQNGLRWKYRRIRSYDQLGRKVEMLKEGIPAIGI
jgi:hypothetical protein